MTREREYFFGEDRGRGGGRAGGAGGRGGFVHKSAIVKQLKETMQAGHKTGLPPNILDYFTPREPLKPGVEITKKKKPVPFYGVAAYVEKFAGPQDPEEVKDAGNKQRLFVNPELALQCRLTTETRIEKGLRLNQWKKEEAAAAAAEALKAWDPHKDSKIEGDPFRTLFVSRLSYDVTEKKLRKEFEEYGPIKSVRIVTDKNGKSRGYAFVEYQDKKDMKEAYKTADGRKIEGRRVLVDVERGRTVESWKPRRLGGGLGGDGRQPKPPKPKNARKHPIKVYIAKMIEEKPRDRSPVRTERDRVDSERERQRADRDRLDRERAERDRADRERVDRERRDRERADRDRKRDRDGSPRRDRDRDDAKRSRRETEDGEVRPDRFDRDRDRERDRGDRGDRRRRD